ncbi:MAG: hypothetical protein R3D51_11350 [Hyphomicrobiaceae bacterium]
MAKKPPPDQLSLDLVFTAPVAPASAPKRVRQAKQEPVPVVVPEPEPVAEILAPNEPHWKAHESAQRRETTAFDLYQRSVKDTRNLVLTAFVVSVAIVSVKFNTTSIDTLSLPGVDLKVSDRRVVTGLLGMGALFFGAWALLSAFSTWGLWKKCGLFYQEIVRPSSHPLLVLLFRFVWVAGAVFMTAAIVVSVVYSFEDIWYVFFGAPEWMPDWWEKSQTIQRN